MLRNTYLGPCQLPTRREWRAMQEADRFRNETGEPWAVVDASFDAGSDLAVISEELARNENIASEQFVYLTS